MNVTEKLVKLFQVEKQIRGLRSRLDAAERFLAEQTKELAALDARKATLETQSRTLTAQASDHEGEMKRLDARIATIREQMNSSQTNKQYQAFLVEANNHKADRDKIETVALEVMSRAEDARKNAAESLTLRAEREKICKVARAERDARHQEIQSRLDELQKEREIMAGDIPPPAMSVLTMLLKNHGEDAMASVQVEDRKRHEYTCGSCQMSIPIEAVSVLRSSGSLTRCVSCQCILFLDETASKALETPEKRKERAGPKVPR